MAEKLKVAVAQLAPVLLDRQRTLAKVVAAVEDAATSGARLICFGEAFVPGYPAWLSRTESSRWDDAGQKQLHALYLEQAVDIDAGDLEPVCEAARLAGIWVVLGSVERPADRGGHSLYCSCVTIGSDGSIRSVHRKLMPTYDERLCWGTGDGHGLRVHDLPPFRLGSLNCWENWMPLARTALYAQGENLHVALWPGCDRNTCEITRFIACESRSFVISASSVLSPDDILDDVPLRARIVENADDAWYNGGSAIARPDGSWLVEPQIGGERLITAELDLELVLQERQNFDPSGHYSRPDVLRLEIDRRRQTVVTSKTHAEPVEADKGEAFS